MKKNLPIVLKKEAAQLTEIVDELLERENDLYVKYSFFQRPFMFCEKNYLQYVEKEMTDLRKLFRVYSVTLE